MAKQTQVFAFRGVNMQCIRLIPSDGTNQKTVISAGPDDSVIRHLSIVNPVTQQLLIDFFLHDGSNSTNLFVVKVPAGAGFDGTNGAFDVFGGGLLSFFRALPLKTGWSLRCALRSAITSNAVHITAIADEF
jgi:hypothetical protein